MTNSNYRLQCRDRELDLTGKAKIMGVLNTTPDSFFDGGRLGDVSRSAGTDSAVKRALEMVAEGADIIDVGGESTRPGAQKVDAEEEIRRTVPVIRELRKQSDVLISIDTYKSPVAEQALLAGAQIVNDVSGFSFDPALAEVCKRYNAAPFLMHTTGRPESMKWSHQINTEATGIVSRVTKDLRASLQNAEKHGVVNILLDPGFGFGKSVAENYTLLAGLSDLQILERPLVVGLSRKSFLGAALQNPGQPLPPPEDRLTATIAANTIAVLNGASVLRTHDIREAAETVSVAATLMETMGEIHPPS